MVFIPKSVFCLLILLLSTHGLLGEEGRGYIALGYNYIPGDNKELNIYASDIKDKIYATAFDNPYCWFGSCNLGNNTTDSFAQTWVNKFGGITYAFNGKSYYGYMNSGETKEQRSIRKIWGFRFDGSNNYPVPGDDATAHEFYRKG